MNWGLGLMMFGATLMLIASVVNVVVESREVDKVIHNNCEYLHINNKLVPIVNEKGEPACNGS